MLWYDMVVYDMVHQTYYGYVVVEDDRDAETTRLVDRNPLFANFCTTKQDYIIKIIFFGIKYHKLRFELNQV